MSDSNSTTRSVIPWFMIYLVVKFAGVKAFLDWSWWWLLLPIVPLVVELFEALTA